MRGGEGENIDHSQAVGRGRLHRMSIVFGQVGLGLLDHICFGIFRGHLSSCPALHLFPAPTMLFPTPLSIHAVSSPDHRCRLWSGTCIIPMTLNPGILTLLRAKIPVFP